MEDYTWLTLYLWPFLYALVIWWGSTGIIIWLAQLPKRTFPYSLGAYTALLGVCLWQLYARRDDTSVAGAYAAFTWATLAWGWQELSYYTGVITGVKRPPCDEGCSGWKHFGHGVQANIYHELTVVAGVLVLLAIHWGAANALGLWVYLFLWWMHQSAKLNIFFGVRNLNEEFIPEHLKYMVGYMKKRPMNAFFPISVTLCTVVAAELFHTAFGAATPFVAVGTMFLALFMSLAILEHWFLVLPFNNNLWNWSLRGAKDTLAAPVAVEVVTGFLGSGKTTFMRQLLANARPEDRTLVLVNDFGEIGVDGQRLKGRGADVVELPNGCICCSLRGDLTTRLRETALRFQPKRLLIEPSGVAELGELIQALYHPSLAGIVGPIKVYYLVDALGFLESFGRNPRFFELQARLAPALVLTKADLVGPETLTLVRETVGALNPDAQILNARFGVVDAAALAAVPSLAARAQGEPGHEHEHEHVGHALVLATEGRALGQATFALGRLRELLDDLAAGVFGEVARAKGILRVEGGWVNFDIAAGRLSITACPPAESGVVTLIGRELRFSAFDEALRACEAARGAQPALAV
jgi:putative photosynthetic complex assembly protein 2